MTDNAWNVSNFASNGPQEMRGRAANHAAHTPGPWKAERHYKKEDEYWYSLTVNAEHQIAKVYGRTITDAQSDARLIAAAPELLDVVQALVDALASGGPSAWLLDKARVALDKATCQP